MSHSFLMFTCVLLAVGHVSTACKVENWKPMTLGEQVQEAEIVIYGRISAHYPMPDVPIERAYIATMDVYCVLKGDLPRRKINISEAGELTSCHHTSLPVNQTFITFVLPQEGGMYRPDEVNYLSVAFEPTDANVDEVLKAVGGRGEMGTLKEIMCTQFGQDPDDNNQEQNDNDGGRNGVAAFSGGAAYVIAVATIVWLQNIV